MSEIRRAAARTRKPTERPRPLRGLGYCIWDLPEPDTHELGIVAGSLVYRWKGPTGLWTVQPGVIHLLRERMPRAESLTLGLGAWDSGRCFVAGDGSDGFRGLQLGLRRGHLRLHLQDGRARGTYCLQRVGTSGAWWMGWRVQDFPPAN